MPELLHIDGRSAPAFAQLTYPAFRQALLAAGQTPSVIAVGALEQGTPVALALAERDGDCVRVLSLFTAAQWRKQGLAGSVLAMVEQVARSTGADAMELKYMSGRPSDAALTRLLDKQAWEAPEPRMLFLRAHRRPLEETPRWIREPAVPGGMTVFAWKDLDKDAELRLREDHARQPWVAPELDPFNAQPWDPPYDGKTSVGLACGDDVVGWMITHRISQDTMRYSQWCIHPGLRRGAAGGYLLAEAIRRQLLLTDVPWLQLGVYLHNRTMLRFLERHLDGYFSERYFSIGRRKALVSA